MPTRLRWWAGGQVAVILRALREGRQPSRSVVGGGGGAIVATTAVAGRRCCRHFRPPIPAAVPIWRSFGNRRGGDVHERGGGNVDGRQGTKRGVIVVVGRIVLSLLGEKGRIILGDVDGRTSCRLLLLLLLGVILGRQLRVGDGASLVRSKLRTPRLTTVVVAVVVLRGCGRGHALLTRTIAP